MYTYEIADVLILIKSLKNPTVALISTTTSLSLFAHHDLPDLTSCNILAIPTTSPDTHISAEFIVYGILYQSSTLITL